jgi:hypothetical protein
LRIVRTGTWLYDGSVELPVDIIGLPFDFWYEIGRADGDLDADEVSTPLGDDGLLYYYRFRNPGSTVEPTWVDSVSFSTVAEAMAAAETKSATPVRWE